MPLKRKKSDKKRDSKKNYLYKYNSKVIYLVDNFTGAALSK